MTTVWMLKLCKNGALAQFWFRPSYGCGCGRNCISSSHWKSNVSELHLLVTTKTRPRVLASDSVLAVYAYSVFTTVSATTRSDNMSFNWYSHLQVCFVLAFIMLELISARSSADAEGPCEHTVRWNRVECCTNVRRIAFKKAYNLWMTFQGHCHCCHLIVCSFGHSEDTSLGVKFWSWSHDPDHVSFSGWFVTDRLEHDMINLPTTFEVPTCTCYGNMKGVAKHRKWGGLGRLGVTQGHW